MWGSWRGYTAISIKLKVIVFFSDSIDEVDKAKVIPRLLVARASSRFVLISGLMFIRLKESLLSWSLLVISLS